MAKKITTEVFKQRAQELFPQYDYSKSVYQNARTKIEVICPKHGSFFVTPDNHLNKQSGCPKCYEEIRSKIRTSSVEIFIEKAKKIHGTKYSYSKFIYKDAHTKGIIVCPKHGEFEQNPNNHLSGKGCPKCRNEKFTKTTQDYIESFKQIHNNFYDYSKVNKIINNNMYITIICPFHGEFVQTVRSHQEGRGCPHCSKSKGELLVSKILKSLNFNFEEQVFIKNPYHSNNFIVDFFIRDYNTIIEFNGKQHYVSVEHFGGKMALNKQKQRDEDLRIYCQQNKINLLEIKFDYFEKDIENLLKAIRDYD